MRPRAAESLFQMGRELGEEFAPDVWREAVATDQECLHRAALFLMNSAGAELYLGTLSEGERSSGREQRRWSGALSPDHDGLRRQVPKSPSKRIDKGDDSSD